MGGLCDDVLGIWVGNGGLDGDWEVLDWTGRIGLTTDVVAEEVGLF